MVNLKETFLNCTGRTVKACEWVTGKMLTGPGPCGFNFHIIMCEQAADVLNCVGGAGLQNGSIQDSGLMSLIFTLTFQRLREEKKEERRRRELERKRLRDEERRKWREEDRRKRKEAEKLKKAEKAPEKDKDQPKEEQPKIKVITNTKLTTKINKTS